MNLLDLVQQVLSNEVVGKLNNQMPQVPQQNTQTAAQLAMSTLMSALAKNTQSEQGLQGLLGALNKDHNGGLMDNLGDFLSGNMANNRSTDGVGILSHLFGGKIFDIVELVSKGSGVDRNNTMSMLVKLAPVALSMLGKVKQQNNYQGDELRAALQKTVQQERQQVPQTSLIEKLLDRDGDGSVKDEVMQMGMKALGSFFSR
jgi:hypothetical protein